MTAIKELTNQLNQVDVNNADRCESPPSKINKAVAPPAAAEAISAVTFDPAIPATEKVKKPVPVPSNVTPASFGALETGKTPKKVKVALDKGIAPVEVKDRWDNCTGIPLKVFKFTKSGDRISRTCCMCKTGSTAWYCMGCKSWFCVSGTKDTETREKKYVCQTIKGEEYVFEMSCFHQKHQPAWEREEGKERLDMTVKKLEGCAAELETLKGTYNLNL